MTKLPGKVDTATIAELVALGAERDVVRFILAYDGVDFVEPIAPERDSRASMKRLKRRVQRRAGARWREEWAEVKRIRRGLREVRRAEGLFTLEPLPPRRPGRPRDFSRWLAFFDLRTYLVRVTGHPHTRLLGRLVLSHLKSKSVEEEWSHHSRWFAGIDAEARLEALLQFYRAHTRLIRRALITGRPLRHWLAQGAGGPAESAPTGRTEPQIGAYVGQCPHCGTSYTFLRFPTIPDPRHHAGPQQESGWRTGVCECGASFAWKPPGSMPAPQSTTTS